MKVFLLFQDQDLDLDKALPPQHKRLTQDLELTTLVDGMAAGDNFVSDVARKVLLTSLTDTTAICYRQQILADCLAQPGIVREMYELAGDALQSERKVPFVVFRDNPAAILRNSLRVLQLLVDQLKQLSRLADSHAHAFSSDGFTRFFNMLHAELDADFFSAVAEYLKELRFPRGVLMSAALGNGNKSIHHVLHQPPTQGWLRRITDRERGSYSFEISDRDEAGMRALRDLEARGVNLVANTLAQSRDHVISFFRMLRTELAFYVGCLNLHDRLGEMGEPTSFPIPRPLGTCTMSAQGLYDSCLTLTLEGRAVGNDVEAPGKTLMMVTGANQGGKSTFLRSVGLAQLMMQCGMFVAADLFDADVHDGIFTHYKRPEDTTMRRGKLDEELDRMSQIADQASPHSLVLCNESFASTNEREGSEIARHIVTALTDSGVKVVFVTHLFDLAHGLYCQGLDTMEFLRAYRQEDGTRTFRVVVGEPLPTSYGADSYRRVFGVPMSVSPP